MLSHYAVHYTVRTQVTLLTSSDEGESDLDAVSDAISERESRDDLAEDQDGGWQFGIKLQCDVYVYIRVAYAAACMYI